MPTPLMVNMSTHHGKHLLNSWSISQQRLQNYIYIMLHIANSWYTSYAVMVNTFPIYGEQLNRLSFTHNQLMVNNHPTLCTHAYTYNMANIVNLGTLICKSW